MRGARVPEEAREASARTRSKFAPCGRFPRLLGYTFSLFFSARDAYGAAALLIICAHQHSKSFAGLTTTPSRQAAKRPRGRSLGKCFGQMGRRALLRDESRPLEPS